MAPGVEVCQAVRNHLAGLNGDVEILWICPMAGTAQGAVGVKRKNGLKESEDKIKKAKFVVVKDIPQPMTLLEILEYVRNHHVLGKPYKIWDTGAITDAEGEPSRGPVFNEGIVRMPMVMGCHSFAEMTIVDASITREMMKMMLGVPSEFEQTDFERSCSLIDRWQQRVVKL